MILALGAVLGLLIGAAVLAALRVIVPSLFPEQSGLYAGFYVGILPTNPDGTFARRDYWRMARFSFVGALACLALAIAGALFLSLVPRHGAAEQLLLGIFFIIVLLMLLCAAAALLHVARAVRWRPRRLASEWSPPSADDSPSNGRPGDVGAA